MLVPWSSTRPVRAVLLAAVALAAALFPAAALAQPAGGAPRAAVGAEGDFVVRDFRFGDGSALPSSASTTPRSVGRGATRRGGAQRGAHPPRHDG
jgi:hypothetical protein